jgi:glycosyltransferase involved in cell wall biosynthesis
MRIGIDARYLSHGLAGGVHTYVEQLIRGLIRVGVNDQLVLYADAKMPFEMADLPAGIETRVLPWRSPWSTVANDFALAGAMARDAIDVAHFPANYGRGATAAATVVTLHDTLNLLPLRKTLWSRGSPQSVRSRATSAYLRWWTWRSVMRAEVIVTVSEYSRREIMRAAGLSSDRVVAVPHGAPFDGAPVTNPDVLDAVRRELRVEGRFVLADALKNPEALLQAWHRLPAEARRQRRVLFFARHRDLFPAVFDAVAAGVAQLVVRPTTAQLAALYSMADAFVFPSWMEGFGLPVLEAMAYGAPVVCSTRGALPEVAGEAARLVAPDDIDGMVQALAALLMDAQAAARLRDKGLARAQQFSWDRTAREVRACYARARALKAA